MRIQDTIVQLLLKQPFYGYIAASITPHENNEISSLRMILEPSLTLLYNKEWFEGLKLEHASGAIIHELLHLIFMHPFRKQNRESHLWIVACDMAVNEYIDSCLLPGNAVTVDAVAKQIKTKIPKGKSAEFYYDVITKIDNTLNLIEKESEIIIVFSNGDELKANSSMEGDTSEINKTAFRSMFSEILSQAKSEGDVPEGLAGIVEEMYSSGEINWRNVLKRFLSGKGKMLSRKTYKKESKRYEGLPGNKRTMGVKALLAIDESGSISGNQFGQFFKEVLNIRRITNADLYITEFDNNCTEPVPIERYIKKKLRVKNGGTDFRPIFKLADKMHIPLVIIFTDGEGIAPSSCNQDVLWIMVKGSKRPAQFGYCIEYKS